LSLLIFSRGRGVDDADGPWHGRAHERQTKALPEAGTSDQKEWQARREGHAFGRRRSGHEAQARKRSMRLPRSEAGAALAPLAFVALVLLVGAPAEARATSRGSIDLRISGLPKGQALSEVLRGPGVRRRVTRQRISLKRVRPGRYTLTLRRVKITRPTGAVKRGAIATPTPRSSRVRVRSGRRARICGIYGTNINPGIVSIHPTVFDIAGPVGNPSSLVLAGRRRSAKDAILSIPPSKKLPRGVLSHVVTARTSAGRTTVTLVPASVCARAKREHDRGGDAARGDAASARRHFARSVHGSCRPALLYLLGRHG
jgi:hypothetical protein